MKAQPKNLRILAGILATAFLTLTSSAQRGGGGPQVISPQVGPDRTVTFRVVAPRAQAVRLTASDIPRSAQPTNTMTQGADGVWQLAVGPVDPGAYRYNFNVDGLAVIDPRNPATSESQGNTWSLVVVPGSDFIDTKDVPHGAVASVTYYSKSLQRFRRMHIYTPPNYENGQGKLPVFYLLHGASDSDNSWTSVGRAGFIMDNLIAANKAKPMIVVMPAGHITGSSSGAGRGAGAASPAANEFTSDFMGDIMPFVESHYRVRTERADRAIAGLSMGGGQTLAISIPHLDKFAYIGVFSSGIGLGGGARRGGAGGDGAPSYEEQNKATLDNPELKQGLKLVWFATGKEDSLIATSRSSVELLKKHQFDVVFKETAGAHTWFNWRDYLIEFAPQLFQ
jgi:enterochelin esterase-like enzyme